MRVLKPLNVSVCEFQNRTVCVCVFVCVCVKFEENESVKFVFERVDTVHTTQPTAAFMRCVPEGFKLDRGARRAFSKVIFVHCLRHVRSTSN